MFYLFIQVGNTKLYTCQQCTTAWMLKNTHGAGIQIKKWKLSLPEDPSCSPPSLAPSPQQGTVPCLSHHRVTVPGLFWFFHSCLVFSVRICVQLLPVRIMFVSFIHSYLYLWFAQPHCCTVFYCVSVQVIYPCFSEERFGFFLVWGNSE